MITLSPPRGASVLGKSLWLGLSLGFLSMGAFAAETPSGPVLSIIPDHPDGCYAIDEKVTWTVDVMSGNRSDLAALPYVVKLDGKGEAAQGVIDLTNGPATLTASRAESGALLAVIGSPDKANTKPLALGGALVAKNKIAAAAPAPEDFDTFWGEKLKELATVPANPQVEEIPLEGIKEAEGIVYSKVTLDNVRSTHVLGQLARPKVGDKFPAMLMFQHAGVYPLDKRSLLENAKAGWLVLNIQAHDIPVEGPPEFYDQLGKNELKNYFSIGSDDKDTSYFVRMILGCIRAAEYLTSRPDWDGRILVTTGASQGGFQSYATAALFPKVTHLMVMVPAGGDTDAPYAVPPRGVNWPYWSQKDLPKVRQTGRYFDSILFAARTHCSALAAVALLDETAYPFGVIAGYNAIPAYKEKELLIMPLADHRGSGGTQAAYARRFREWREAIKTGSPLP